MLVSLLSLAAVAAQFTAEESPEVAVPDGGITAVPAHRGPTAYAWSDDVDDLDHAAVDAEIKSYDAVLGRVLSSDRWTAVVPGPYLVPVAPAARLDDSDATASYEDAAALLWGGTHVRTDEIRDLLTELPAFVPVDHVGHNVTEAGAIYQQRVSNAKVEYGPSGLPAFAARGVVVSAGGGCDSFSQLQDYLVAYDDDGRPTALFASANSWSEGSVDYETVIATVEYDGDGLMTGLDVRARRGQLGDDIYGDGAPIAWAPTYAHAHLRLD